MNYNFKRLASVVLLSIIAALSTLSLAAVQPKFSNGATEHWYSIKFTAGGFYLCGNGINKTMIVKSNEFATNQQWKLVGDANSFHLMNRDGHYAAVKDGWWSEIWNACPLQEVHAKPGKGFKLAERNGEYEIETLYKPGYYLNTWKGANSGREIGIWKTSGDINNMLVFEPVPAKGFSVSGIANYKPKNKHTLWYATQAKRNGVSDAWMEYSLPIGNGQMGASVFADVLTDEILFNEKTLWTGTSKSVGTKGNGNNYGAYQVFGAIHIDDLNALGKVTGYHRDLDLTNATATMSYTENGVDYKREYIVSYPHKVVATHLTATQQGKININVALTPKMSKGASRVDYTMEGEMGVAHFNGKLDVVSFDARMKVVAKGGLVNATKGGITVENADEVMILLAAGTDFDNTKPEFVFETAKLSDKMKERVDAAAAETWTNIYSAHVDDYKYFFDRVNLDLTGSENNMDTKALVDSYKGDSSANDLMLEELYFNYGRYLEIASSRGVALPSNLQGIWASRNNHDWNADIHANINVQMNYWPAEPTNMPEMHEPFLRYIIRMAKSEPWLRYAKESKQQRGWTCYTENNIFGGVGVYAHNYVIENAWYCTHLWQHYRYTMDKDFLAEAFPVMLSAAQFWMDRLIFHEGQYLCPNEYSPEHGPEAQNGVAHAQQLVWELFDNTLKAVEVLGENVIPATDLTQLREKFSKLDKGLATEQGPNGPLLREWKYSAYNNGKAQLQHRHMSHLMCLYPFSQVNSKSEFFQPAINSMLLRGDASTGWSMGWKMNLWARALDGNHAHNILKMALKHSTSYKCEETKGGIYYNLFDSHAPFQIDGNFGACAGIAEMLFQSHGDVLNFLPALPDVWSNGSITGLKGIGNFTVGIQWQKGKATKLTIVNVKGQKCLVKCNRGLRGINLALVTVNGKFVEPVTSDGVVYEIPSGRGDRIVIDFEKSKPVYSGKCGESLNWNLSKETGVLTITGNGAMYDYTIENPSPWEGVAEEIKSIAFPAEMTHIGSYAFKACTQPMEIGFSDNEVTIGENAFSSSIRTVLEINDADYKTGDFPLNGNRYDKMIVNRVLDEGQWGTIVLPFDVNFGSTLLYDFYKLSSVVDNVMTFKYVRYPLADVPYLYRNVEGAKGHQIVSAGGVFINPSPDFSQTSGEWTMLGTYKHLKIVDKATLQTTYYLAGGKVMNSSASVHVRPFRTYFNGPVFDAVNPSRALRILIEDENGEMTDITDVLMDEAPDNGDIYDLTGRRVMKTVPGHIYIQNGNKFIAK